MLLSKLKYTVEQDISRGKACIASIDSSNNESSLKQYVSLLTNVNEPFDGIPVFRYRPITATFIANNVH